MICAEPECETRIEEPDCRAVPQFEAAETCETCGRSFCGEHMFITSPGAGRPQRWGCASCLDAQAVTS